MGGWAYRLFKAYFKILNNHLLYRNIYILGKENIPEGDGPLMVVSNHQNNANDALGLILMFKNRQFPTISTSGVFLGKLPFLKSFFYGLGMLPAYRADYEGLENVDKNIDSQEEMKRRLLLGCPLIIYPEGTGQFGRYLGRFIPNYLHIAFQAAESEGWKRDIKVVPSANHYSDYFDVQTEFMIRVGEPLSLRPYYERYQQKPRTTVREINELLRNRVLEMMLHVEDRAHYDAIDFLRTSAFGDTFAGASLPLPERLEKDKQFVRLLQENANDEFYEKVMRLRTLEQTHSLKDQWVAENVGWGRWCAGGLMLALLLPLWILSLWPHALFYWLPTLLLGENLMYTNTYRVLLNSLVLAPVAAVVTFGVTAALGVWWLGVVWVALWPLQARFAWWMWQRLKRWSGQYFILGHKPEMSEVKDVRDKIASQLLFFNEN